MLGSTLKVLQNKKLSNGINVVPKQNHRPDSVDIPLHNFQNKIVIEEKYEPVLSPDEVNTAKNQINLEIKQLFKVIQSAEMKANRIELTQNFEILEKSFKQFYDVLEEIDNLLVHEDAASKLVPSTKDYSNTKIKLQEDIYQKYI